MKKITTITLAGIMLLAATTVTAQTTGPTEPIPSRWSFGPKTGLNLSHFWGTDFAKDNDLLRPGGNFGMFVTWSDEGWFAVTGELLYSGKGTRYSFERPGEDLHMVTRMSYVEMPLIFRFFPVDEGPVRPHISMGPSVGILVLAHNQVLNAELDNDPNGFYDDARKVDVGANFGGGVNFWVKRVWINPEVRYNLGLVNVMDDTNVRNGTVNLSVGVGIPLSTVTTTGNTTAPAE